MVVCMGVVCTAQVSHELAGEGVLLGQFDLPGSGGTAVLIQNHNTDWTLWPTLVAAAPAYDLRTAMELDGLTGRLAPLEDDSPMMAGWQMSLQPGMARLVVFSRARRL